jgi:hypothetical protein
MQLNFPDFVDHLSAGCIERRVKNLLGVSSRERIELRRRIGGEAEAGGEE